MVSKGISIHIGLNHLDESHYGEVPTLDTCEQDARDMQRIAIMQNYKSSTLLLSESATREAVKSSIIMASSVLEYGDILFLTYSGHGGLTYDVNGDEDDGVDETWCLYDGQLIDDELRELWSYFNEGVRIFVISDSCHSGTVVKANMNKEQNKLFKQKLLPVDVAKNIYIKNKDFYDEIQNETTIVGDDGILATVKLFAACLDPQVSYTLAFATNSIFTEKIKEPDLAKSEDWKSFSSKALQILTEDYRDTMKTLLYSGLHHHLTRKDYVIPEKIEFIQPVDTKTIYTMPKPSMHETSFSNQKSVRFIGHKFASKSKLIDIVIAVKAKKISILKTKIAQTNNLLIPVTLKTLLEDMIFLC